MSSENTHGGDPATVARRLGMQDAPAVELDFSVNVNPLGPPPCVSMELASAAETIRRYPEHHAAQAAEALARAHGVDPKCVLLGNGATELFSWILQAFAPSSVGWVSPAYSGYAEACRALKISGRSIGAWSSENDFQMDLHGLNLDETDVLFLATPNNPTGATLSPDAVLELAAAHKRKMFVVDESFMDFLPDAAEQTLIRDGLPVNLVVVKSMTKFFDIPGLRLGMAFARPETTARLRQAALPWTVNGIAQALCPNLYAADNYIISTREQVASLRSELISGMQSIEGVRVFPSAANYLLIQLPSPWTARQLQGELLKRGILIRACEDYEGLDERYCRLAVRPAWENARLLESLGDVIANRPAAASTRTPAIMVVGTTSNAGKSAVAVGLCRYLARRGLAVAPFKAQNMALNSFVTREGGEMGRAQVVQAHAAGVEPHTDMNPVLLKPLGDDGSQVIVNGHAIGNYKARAYYAMKAKMRKAAHEAYDRLAERFETIVLEGAGSPAEINLLAEDFVNMDMAAYADAATILVADIDRGGVFASIFGTIALVPPRYRHLIKGVVINKFRGDVSLLDSGIEQIEAMTGVPVLGVLPYIKDLALEDEDSLGLEGRNQRQDALLDIAVVRLPRISNFTDFLALERTPGVRVRYLTQPASLGAPDLIIIPGTKNTRGDLSFLHESGWTEAILDASKRDIPLIGICGGYQMLGTEVADPDGVEGAPGSETGLGLLPVVTTLHPRKELAQVEGITTDAMPLCPSGTTFSGYEIHAGETVPLANDKSLAPLTVTRRGESGVNQTAGTINSNSLVMGCYIHGFFDAPDLRRALLTRLCDRKGVHFPDEGDAESAVDAFDELADSIEQHLDLSPLTPNVPGIALPTR